MPEDRSLDDFAGASASEEAAEATTEGDEVEVVDDAESEAVAVDEADTAADDTEDADGNEAIAGSEADDSETVEPPSITATWATDGVACERCDAAVERRWACDGDYVCADCKDW
ncbi:DUF7573 domain-containing protein [Haloparvum sp. PAK95]|uniref:DUF7573 domain-containing protein n=1 Tax=Haloparvum sp. PAK95 TaxID=3418962 RepID=UPI003D2EE2BD